MAAKPEPLFEGRPFKKGDKIIVVLTGVGVTSREDGHEVLRVQDGVVYSTDSDHGYDAATGRWLGPDFSGFSRRLEAA